MSQFERLFGIKSMQIRKICVLLPCVDKDLLTYFGVKNLKRGKLYGSASVKDFSLIHTGMGPALVGDAVLYLKETLCQNVILFGSCGSVGDLDIGSLVLPVKCLAQESFTEMLKNNIRESRVFYPDNELCEAFVQANKESDIKKVACMTIASLKLEEELSCHFKEMGIDVVDMECSAFFSASRHLRLKAMSLFYVSDVIIQKPFYVPLGLQDRKYLDASVKKAIGMLCNFAREN